MRKRFTRIIAGVLFLCMLIGSVPVASVYGAEVREQNPQGEVQISDESEESVISEQPNGNDQMPELDSPKEIIDESDISEEDMVQAESDLLLSEEGRSEETVTDEALGIQVGEINFVYVESPYLETPDTQRIVFAFDQAISGVDTITLTVESESGSQETWGLSRQAEYLYLFEKEYTGDAYTGTYHAVSLNLYNGETEKDIVLEEVGVVAEFGVNQKYEGIDELKPIEDVAAEEQSQVNASIVTIDENGVTEAQDSIAEALNVVADKNIAENGISTFSATKKTSERSGDIVVALDPGHDANDAGASGNGLREEELTLKIANYCKEELEEYAGVSVYMTRTTAACPYNCTSAGSCIQQRVQAAANAGAQIYVSLHLNSSVSSSAHGAEVIVPNKSWKEWIGVEGAELGQTILDELVKLGLTDRGIYSKDTTVGEKYEDGSISDYFSVQIYCKENNIPGIIVEHAFISNSGEANSFLKTEAGLRSLGVADATGIAKYLGLLKGHWEEENGNWKWVWNDGSPSPKNQWLYVLGSWYWLDEKGYRLSDCWGTISGQRYYFDSDGKMAIGWRFLNNNWYYFQKSGRVTVGWQWIGTCWYWFAEDGKMLTGWQTIGGIRYYFNEKGHMLIGWQEIDGDTYYFLENGHIATGIVTISEKIYEFTKDGVLVREIIPGWLLENGIYYWINENGSKAVGWKWIGTHWYWFAKDGKMLTGWQNISNQRYYFLENGHMVIGWQDIGGNTYYFLENGHMATGVVSIDGKMYEFTENGTLVRQIMPGWLLENGTYYWINEDGSRAVGWKWIGVHWYWFAKDGEMLTGWQDIGNQRYYFHENGHMLAGWQEINGDTYYFQENGHMVTGIVSIDGKMYEFTEDGALVKEIIPGWLLENGTYYWINEDGSRAVGWKWIGVHWYWFAKNGEMLTGWQDIGNQRYYFHEKGHMLTGWQEIGEKIYYFLESGHMVTGVIEIDGKTYVFGSDGSLIEALLGWLRIGDVYYYIKGDGSKAVGWELIGGDWYWFAEDGKMQTGWQYIGDIWYYFYESGRMLTGWQMIDGTWSYFDESGHWIKSGVTTITGTSNKTKEAMISFYEKSGYTYPSEELTKGGAPTLESFVQMYIDEAKVEGIRADVAFAQAMLETKYLQYGGDVLIGQFNFAGIGAVGGGANGASFPDVRTGIRAHIQHLKAYANSDPLKNTCVDPRFAYVTRGTAPYVEWLGIQENPEGCGWASAKNYGFTIATMMERM